MGGDYRQMFFFCLNLVNHCAGAKSDKNFQQQKILNIIFLLTSPNILSGKNSIEAGFELCGHAKFKY